jgi:4-hydroxymandelate oxidase
VKYHCAFCKVFIFDEQEGDTRAEIPPSTTLQNLSMQYRCPVCGHWKGDLQPANEQTYKEKRPEYLKLHPPPAKPSAKDLSYYQAIARKMLQGVCAVNKVCDGNPDRLCQGQKYGKSIGFGGAGQGKTWSQNFLALNRYQLKMETIKPHQEPNLEATFLRKKLSFPILPSSVSGTKISMNNALGEAEFQRGMIEGAKKAGTLGLCGNTVDFPDHPGINVIAENGGWGIPVFKPQSQQRLLELFKKAEKANAVAIGVDLDGYGSTNWALRGKPLYRKSERELHELVDATEKPVIFKGIMNLEDAAKAVDAGAVAIDVSNHGGRVMDCGQGVAEVLPKIAAEFKGKITLMADGAVRTGFDALKLLALGADVALVGRPLAWMSLAGGAKAVALFLDYLRQDLRMAMIMTCVDSVPEIKGDILVTKEETC